MDTKRIQRIGMQITMHLRLLEMRMDRLEALKN